MGEALGRLTGRATKRTSKDSDRLRPLQPDSKVDRCHRYEDSIHLYHCMELIAGESVKVLEQVRQT